VTRRLTDRVAGAFLLALAIAYGLGASNFQVGFGDPVGPAAFPRLIAAPLALFALVLILRPDPDPVWKASAGLRQVLTVAVLLVYPLLIETLGFPLSTAIGGALLARLLGAAWGAAALLGLALGFGLFVIFDSLLGLPLPFGPGVFG
jgi:putative tricarboxylic transport membrane protein